jgi:hypothetical protein
MITVWFALDHKLEREPVAPSDLETHAPFAASALQYAATPNVTAGARH